MGAIVLKIGSLLNGGFFGAWKFKNLTNLIEKGERRRMELGIYQGVKYEIEQCLIRYIYLLAKSQCLRLRSRLILNRSGQKT